MNVPQAISAPPSDLPSTDGLEAMMERLGRAKTGWALQVGLDAQNQPILLFRDEIQPPGWIQRLFSPLVGLKWIKTTIK